MGPQVNCLKTELPVWTNYFCTATCWQHIHKRSCPSQIPWIQYGVFSHERTTLKLQEQFLISVYPANASPALLAGLPLPQLTDLVRLGENG